MTETAQYDAAIAAQSNRTLAQRMEDQQRLLEQDPERQRWIERVRDVIRYCRADLNEYLDQDNPQKGPRQNTTMYTSKPLMDLERAADAFCGNLFTPHGWFGMEMSDPRLNNIDDIQKWLQVCNEHMYSIYAGSNFYGVMPSIAMDALSLGDGIQYIGNKRDAGMPYFKYCNPLTTWWKRDEFGKLCLVHEKVSLSAIEALARWGKKPISGYGIDDTVRAAAVGNKHESYTFLHVVYRKDDPIFDGIKFVKSRPYVELWIRQGARENSGQFTQSKEGGTDPMGGIIQQEGYFTMPFMDWPYWLKGNETYGQGPLSSCVFTLKRLHAEHKQMMLAGQRAAAPPKWASAVLKNQVDLSPDGITWVKDPERERIADISTSYGGYPFGMDQLDRSEKEIASALQLDFFMMISMTTKEMQNPEVAERIAEKAAALSPRIGSMQYLFLNQAHERTFQLEQTNGRLPAAPDILFELRKKYGISTEMSVRYTGPMAQAHKSLFTRRRLQATFGNLDPFFQIDPDTVKAKINVASAVEHVLDESDFYADSMRTNEEAAQIIDAQNQMLAAAQEAQTAQAGADAVQKLTRAAKESRE